SVEIFFEFIRWPAYRCGAGDSRHAARASFDHLVGVGKERICANDPTASVCQLRHIRAEHLEIDQRSAIGWVVAGVRMLGYARNDGHVETPTADVPSQPSTATPIARNPMLSPAKSRPPPVPPPGSSC